MGDQEDITLGLVVGGGLFVCFLLAFWFTRKQTGPESDRQQSFIEEENPV